MFWHDQGMQRRCRTVEISAPSAARRWPLAARRPMPAARNCAGGQGLADPVRVKLVSLLFSATDGDVCSATGRCGRLDESTVSHHLTQLRERLVESSGVA